MALKTFNGKNEVYLVNIYAPVIRDEKERLFYSLGALDIPAGTHFYMGGDLDCTFYGRRDWSFSPTAFDHDSLGLRELIDKWRLTDTLDNYLPDENEEAALVLFHETHHTYHYPVAGFGQESSRLDR